MSNHLHIYRAIIAVACLCLSIAYASSFMSRGQRADTAFYVSELQSAGVRVQVTIGGGKYLVVDGAIETDGSAISERDRGRIIRLAYAVALAERKPLFNIAGVDTQSLKDAVHALSATQRAFAQHQTDAQDSVAIQRALYPIDFLLALAAVREARDVFIAHGREYDQKRYEIALQRAAHESVQSAHALRAALEEHLADSNIKIPTLGGTITSASMLEAVKNIETRLQETSLSLREQAKCVSGQKEFCVEGALALRAPEMQDDTALLYASSTALSRLAPAQTGDISISLAHSTCLSGVDGPYIFTSGNPEGRARMPIWYSGGLYFSPTADSDGPVMTHFREQLKMRYAIVNPLQYYICPDVLDDFGAIYAVIATVRFAQAHPEYALEERALLLRSAVYRQSDAANYLRKVVFEVSDTGLHLLDPAQTELQEILHMWSERSAGLDMLISAIAEVNAQDLRLYEEGVPMDISAFNLFVTHSVFPSLFLAGNSSVGNTPLELRKFDAADMRLLSKHMIPYAELLKTVPRDQLAHDIAAFLSFEGITK